MADPEDAGAISDVALNAYGQIAGTGPDGTTYVISAIQVRVALSAVSA